jgi:hypothetical protein
MKEHLIVKIGYSQTQKSGQEIQTDMPILIMQGCIEKEHLFSNFPKDKIQVKLSDGTLLTFNYNKDLNNWFLDHNKKMSDIDKTYSVIRTSERDGSDEILLNYPVTNATVYVRNDGLKMYGEPNMTKSEETAYENLVSYLQAKGVICIDEFKRDLKLIITGNYEAPTE